MNNTLLIIIFISTIIIGTCLNVKIENFVEEENTTPSVSSVPSVPSLPSVDNLEGSTDNKVVIRSNIKKANKSDYGLTKNIVVKNPNVSVNNHSVNDSSDNVHINNNINNHNKKGKPIKQNNEKYYDYKYTINNGGDGDGSNSNSQCKQQPININLNYPVPPPREEAENREPPYNDSVLQNLVGTPVDQVQTSYSVTDNNMYKSWDNYYLPGYSYFPPSTWQLPKENSYIIPKEMKTEKCDVCPLSQSNDYGNFLSGDNLQNTSMTLPPIPDLRDTARIVEKKIVTKKIEKY